MLVDAHAHPTFKNSDRTILEEWTNHRLFAAATDLQNWQALRHLQGQFPQLQTTLGIHPWKVRMQRQSKEMKQIAHILHQEPIVIGEVGLDNSPAYRNSIPQQLDVLDFFLQLGCSLKRPMVVHIVKAHHLFLERYKRFPRLKVYLHRYSGNRKMVHDYQRYNVFYGVAVNETQHLAKRGIPLSQILLESDGLVSVGTFERALSALAKHYQMREEHMAEQLQENCQHMYEVD